MQYFLLPLPLDAFTYMIPTSATVDTVWCEPAVMRGSMYNREGRRHFWLVHGQPRLHGTYLTIPQARVS